MATRPRKSAADFLPMKRAVDTLRRAAKSCKGCDLYKNATQTVFGEGPARANVMFVGEQPGDQEDRQGRPFVGPAGRLVDKALTERESRESRFTSLTRSNISNGYGAASDGFIRSPQSDK